ncbi:MAG: hypothetical protein WCK51_01175 [Armatimonadota bacterium]
MRFALAVFPFLVCGAGHAQTIGGPRTYPQFRDMAGLSGNGFPVLRDGSIGMNGAMSLSTPLGYVLGTKKIVLGLCSRSTDRNLRWFNTTSTGGVGSDGTLQGMFSLDSLGSRIAITHMIVSGTGDSVQHLQYQLPLNQEKTGDWAFSIGCHNVTDRPAANGDDDPVEDSKLSRSFFIVGTKECSREQYFTLGLGGTRWKGFFGSYTLPINDNWRAFGEYDTFNWNFGAATEIEIVGKKAYLQAGLVRGNLATWSINWVF